MPDDLRETITIAARDEASAAYAKVRAANAELIAGQRSMAAAARETAARFQAFGAATGETAERLGALKRDFVDFSRQFLAGRTTAAEYGRDLGFINQELAALKLATQNAGKASMTLWQALNVTGGAAMRTGTGLGYLERSLGSVAAQTIGVNGRWGMMAAMMGRFAVGGVGSIAIIGGIVAITKAIELLSDGLSKAREEARGYADEAQKAIPGLLAPQFRGPATIQELERRLGVAQQALAAAQAQARTQAQMANAAAVRGGALPLNAAAIELQVAANAKVLDAEQQRWWINTQLTLEKQKQAAADEKGLAVLGELAREEGDRAAANLQWRLAQRLLLSQTPPTVTAGGLGPPPGGPWARGVMLEGIAAEGRGMVGAQPLLPATRGGAPTPAAVLGPVLTAINEEAKAEAERAQMIQGLRLATHDTTLSEGERRAAEELLGKAIKQGARDAKTAAAEYLQAAQVISAAGNIAIGIITAARQGSAGGVLQGLGGIIGLAGGPLAPVGAALGVVGGIISALSSDKPLPVSLERVRPGVTLTDQRPQHLIVNVVDPVTGAIRKIFETYDRLTRLDAVWRVNAGNLVPTVG